MPELQHVKIPMADGVRLSAYLVLPDAPATDEDGPRGAWPAILEALPYRKDDLTLGYRFRLANDRIRVRTQLNVRDALEDGRLQAVAVDPLGQSTIHRIIDPRLFILTTTFEF